jgi:hypothetical protein
MGAGSSKGTNESVEGSKNVNEMPEICKKWIPAKSNVTPTPSVAAPVVAAPPRQEVFEAKGGRKRKPKSKKVKRGKRKSVRR